jgi:hypothetical protein
MFLRGSLSLFFVLLMVSCDYVGKTTVFSFTKSKIDTLVNYTRVDELPVFPACKNLIDTAKKNRCFINNLYNHFADSLLKHTFAVPVCINETVTVKIHIDSSGKALLSEIQSSDLIKKYIPKLESITKESIESLPLFFPAIKRGIPVSTVFELPIVIKLK